jgi:hypothetical protein
MRLRKSGELLETPSGQSAAKHTRDGVKVQRIETSPERTVMFPRAPDSHRDDDIC